jgi:hypothetical protein
MTDGERGAVWRLAFEKGCERGEGHGGFAESRRRVIRGIFLDQCLRAEFDAHRAFGRWRGRGPLKLDPGRLDLHADGAVEVQSLTRLEETSLRLSLGQLQAEDIVPSGDELILLIGIQTVDGHYIATDLSRRAERPADR